MKTTLTSLLVVAACSSSTNPTGPEPGPDANHTGSGDAPTGDTIKISGSAVEQSGSGAGTPLAGVAISGFLVSDENTPVATAMSDAQGNYSLTVPTHGAPID